MAYRADDGDWWDVLAFFDLEEQVDEDGILSDGNARRKNGRIEKV